MYFALVYYPEISDTDFHAFRNKWGPYAGLIREHIPFIFPVPEPVNKDQLISHINRILLHWEPFVIRINGYRKTWDHWIILALKEGRENAIQLHDELYPGLLEPYLRRDLPYIPHIGMALVSHENYDFNDPEYAHTLDERRYNNAISELKRL